ncbi:TPA: host cell division inhibitor Icd-like protein [Escherichia coli]
MKFPKTPVQGRGFVRPENQNLQNFGEIIPIISGVIGGSETTIVIWRFIALSTAQPRVIHIEATSEQEARQQSPDGCVMVFAARIRQEVEHV